MAGRETAARRYAEAAFELGRASGTLDAWERDLAAIQAAFAEPVLRRLVEHPGVAYPDKERVLRRVMGRAVAAQPLSLALLMVRRGRPAAVSRMVSRFGELLRRERGIALAEVHSALPLDAAQRAGVARRLGEMTGQRVEMNVSVDAALIGGIAVRIGDRLIDGSVRSRLERLRTRLTTA